jgi:hypothetical protein
VQYGSHNREEIGQIVQVDARLEAQFARP